MPYTLADAQREIALLQAALETLSQSTKREIKDLQDSSDEHDKNIEEFKNMKAKWEGGQRVILFLGAFTVAASVLLYNIFSWSGTGWFTWLTRASGH